jgi:serine/threonine-protein kinase
MDFIEGSPLGEHVKEFLDRPRDAAALVQTVATAVHHAHQRRILHNDLKPANILLDEEGHPHVTDFGLARRFGEGVPPSAKGAVEGTASYMSPEQAEGKEITTTSDVYGLGAILYTLLTGRAPFRGKTMQETLDLVCNEALTPPRMLNSRVERDLEAICLRCLEKDKSQRYVSASSLANDLGRYLKGTETVARSWTPRQRVVAWCRSNKVVAGLVTGVIAVWVFALVMAVSVAEAQKTHLLQATVDGGRFAARDLAQTALLQLRHLGRNIEIATADGALADALIRDDRDALERVVVALCSDQSVPFKTCYVIDRSGVMVAHAPRVDRMIGRDFSWRNHFQGAKDKAARPASGLVHVSRVYRGRSDDIYKFAVSAPILDRQSNFLGTIATSATTGASIGSVFLHDDRRKVALIAPVDINSPEERKSDKHVILYHPGYRKGIDPVEFPSVDRLRTKMGLASGSQLSDPKPVVLHDDNYVDPAAAVAPGYAGRWIAGFAPVGNTGFIVVVQQRFDDAVSLETSTLWNLALWSALASLVVIAISMIGLRQWVRGRRLGAEDGKDKS